MCPPGHYCVGDAKVPCEGGTYALGGNTRCVVCRAGTASATIGHASECSPCDAGTWGGREGMTTCERCLPGEASSVVGRSTPCDPCPEPSFSTSSGATRCEGCPDGTVWRSGTCSECLKGHFCVGDVEMACHDGKYQDETGQTACKAAYDGVYILADRTGVADCHAGHYCVAGVEMACGTGHYQDQTAQSSCVPVPTGFFATPDASAAMPCTAGHYCVGGVRRMCPPSQYQDKDGRTECKDVPPGFTTNDARDSLIECPPGTFCVGGSAVDCPAGHYAPSAGLSACVPCPAGTYALSGSAECESCTGPYQFTNGVSCMPCPAGTHSSSDHTACVDAAGIGVSCPGGWILSSGICTLCPPLTFAGASCVPCDSLTGNVYCQAVESGGVTVRVPASCPADCYITNSSRVLCRGCPSGFACDGTVSLRREGDLAMRVGVGVVGTCAVVVMPWVVFRMRKRGASAEES